MAKNYVKAFAKLSARRSFYDKLDSDTQKKHKRPGSMKKSFPSGRGKSWVKS